MPERAYLPAIRFRDSKLVLGGAAGLIFGTGPLVIAVAVSHLKGDPNPNPIGPGILCGLTFMPSLICLIIGVVTVQYKKQHRRG